MCPRQLLPRTLLPLGLTLIAACADLPSEPGPEPQPPAAPSELQALVCEASTRTGRVACEPPRAGAPGVSGDLIVGGQYQFVNVITDSVAYDSVEQEFAFDLAVQNLIPQPLGTRDGTTLDSAGVKVFFHEQPAATSGSGAVTVENEDGTGTFTASLQPYFRYAVVLDSGETSPLRRWVLGVPPTVETFRFTLYVAAPVPLPDGWIDITPADSVYLPTGRSLTLSAVVRTATGTPVSGATVAWSISDSSVATMSGATVTAGGQPGTAVITATSGPRTGSVVLVVEDTPPFEQIAAAVTHRCALTAGGQAWCWGSNAFGQLGTGRVGDYAYPIRVRQEGRTFVDVAVGARYSCGLTAAGQAYCWGDNAVGQLGDGTDDRAWAPVAVQQDSTLQFVDIEGGDRHVCGLTAAGQAWCWGYNSTGQIGDPGAPDIAVRAPVAVQQGGSAYVEVSAGDRHTCALTAAGQAWCWGDNTFGKLGTGNDTSTVAPVPVQQRGRTYAHVSAGGSHTCALTAAGQTYCWGYNQDGQLGDGTDDSSSLPVPVRQNFIGYAQVSTGLYHTCALTGAGKAYCWGSNGTGQLGTGTSGGRSLVPVAVQQGSIDFAQVEATYDHTWALSEAGGAYRWGPTVQGPVP